MAATYLQANHPTKQMKYRRLNIFIILIVMIFSSLQLNAKSSNTRVDYLTMETDYYLGDYAECSNIGDSIFYVENMYDAMILSYSAIANHHLAFSEQKIGLDNNVYGANFGRARMKARESLEYIIYDLNHNISPEFQFSEIRDRLQAYSLAVLCSRILQTPEYKRVVRFIKDNIVPLKNQFVDKYFIEYLQILYFEIIYALDHNQIDLVCNELLPKFENDVVSLYSVDSKQKARIAMIYLQLAEYLNYKLLESDIDSPILKDMTINVMIHSRDYSLFSKKHGGACRFALEDWKQLKNNLRPDEVVLMYFTYARSSDSWNYVWIIKSNSQNPDIAYSGHSYWSESQSLDCLTQMNEFNKIFIVGTNNMSFTDFSNDRRIVRLHSFSEISNYDKSYQNGNVLAVGNINYSFEKESNFSLEKGIGKLGSFATAKKEMLMMQEIFGDKLQIIQGNAATKDLFYNLNDNLSIIHLSTHGTFDKQRLSILNKENADYGLTGDNIFRSCGLMLSGYNENKDTNFMSAYDIKNLNLSNVDFVFISACESAAGQVLSIGDFSLAEAFHVAGVKNIIAVLDPIREDLASNFAEEFYQMVKNGASYHDAFHTSKSKVCPSERIILFE